MSKIAMLDDEPTTLQVNSMLFKKHNIIKNSDILDTYQNELDFLKAINAKGIDFYDAVVIDQDLGRENQKGYEVITQLQQKGYKGLAILLTGDDSRGMKLQMDLTSGIVYVVKGTKSTIAELMVYLD